MQKFFSVSFVIFSSLQFLIRCIRQFFCRKVPSVDSEAPGSSDQIAPQHLSRMTFSLVTFFLLQASNFEDRYLRHSVEDLEYFIQILFLLLLFKNLNERLNFISILL